MLLREHSKRQTQVICRYIGNNQLRFNELMSCFFSEEPIISQRAAWVMFESAFKNPSFIKSWLKRLVSNLGKPVHDAVKRNTVRLLQFIEIPKSVSGHVTDQCFRLLNSTSETIGVKVFSMTVLANLAVKYPEIGNELKWSIDAQIATASKGFKSRAYKLLKKLPDFNKVSE
jgi:hypothetical protein